MFCIQQNHSVFLHIVALHEVGSNNPDGIDNKRKKGTVAEEDKPKFFRIDQTLLTRQKLLPQGFFLLLAGLNQLFSGAIKGLQHSQTTLQVQQ